MNNSLLHSITQPPFKVLRTFFLMALLIVSTSAFAQTTGGFEKDHRDKSYKKGTNIEYYKNGKIKSVSQYKRKVFYYYTDTYWTIKEYDMEGNLIRLTKKVTQMARRENTETVIKEEVYNYPVKKEEQKDNIRPE